MSLAANTYACCKVCSTGQACGDSCISAAYSCNQGSGCACDEENNAPSSKPKKGKPKFSRTSGALSGILNFSKVASATCGLISTTSGQQWKVGRFLSSGKFLTLEREIKNVIYLANFYSGKESTQYKLLGTKLKKNLKKRKSLCLNLM